MATQLRRRQSPALHRWHEKQRPNLLLPTGHIVRANDASTEVPEPEQRLPVTVPGVATLKHRAAQPSERLTARQQRSDAKAVLRQAGPFLRDRDRVSRNLEVEQVLADQRVLSVSRLPVREIHFRDNSTSWTTL